MAEEQQKEQREERSGEQRMSVPAFGEWEKYFKDGVVPTYSVDFSKIRENRRQTKSRVSVGNDDDMVVSAATKKKNADADADADTTSAASVARSAGVPVSVGRPIVPRRPPTPIEYLDPNPAWNTCRSEPGQSPTPTRHKTHPFVSRTLSSLLRFLGRRLVFHDDMSSWLAFSGCLENRLLSSSAIYRRQLFLIRSLGGYCCRAHMEEGGGVPGVGVSTSQTDAETVIQRITPVLDPSRHKGQAGKIAVIGGCREYTGAPYFAAISALKIGADLSHVFCTKDAAPVIKSYSPELIVHPVLEESYSVRDDEKASVSAKVLSEVTKWIERFDCLVIGPGLGRDPFLLGCVSDIMTHARQSNIPTVIDADGLFLVTNNLDLVRGHSLAVLTPNVNEYKRLVEKVLDCEVDDSDASAQLLSLARRIGGVTILRKGKSDLISDGVTVNNVCNYGSPRRCGGQGDILSGSVAVFSSWARQYISATKEADSKSALNPMVLGSIAGSTLLRRAASLAFEHKKRATLTSDIIEHLGRCLEDISPSK